MAEDSPLQGREGQADKNKSKWRHAPSSEEIQQGERKGEKSYVTGPEGGIGGMPLSKPGGWIQAFKSLSCCNSWILFNRQWGTNHVKLSGEQQYDWKSVLHASICHKE